MSAALRGQALCRLLSPQPALAAPRPGPGHGPGRPEGAVAPLGGGTSPALGAGPCAVPGLVPPSRGRAGPLASRVQVRPGPPALGSRLPLFGKATELVNK